MAAFLELREIETFYGSSQALFGVSLDVHEGECVTLLGRNGVGKTTLINTAMGLLVPARGTICVDGVALQGQPSYRVARSGIGLVPEGRHIFPTLSVHENLVATAGNADRSRDPWTVARVYEMFPRLKERERNLGANLSGGEQQMLAIGRALLTNPKLLILDEATEGLSPLVRAEIWRCLEQLKRSGLALLIVDKNIGPLLRLGDRHLILGKGQVVWSGSSDELRGNRTLLNEFIGV